MELIAPIGETCSQDIPITNYSNKEWNVKVNLECSGIQLNE
jgi:hypothetical protein